MGQEIDFGGVDSTAPVHRAMLADPELRLIPGERDSQISEMCQPRDAERTCHRHQWGTRQREFHCQ